MYNFNKTGFIIDQISTRVVVTALDRLGQLKQVQLGNREQTTVIQGVNTKGQAILPFVIFQASNYLLNQYKEEDLLYNQVIRVSNNSQTIIKLSLKQLKYFNTYLKGVLLEPTIYLLLTAIRATSYQNSSNTIRIIKLLLSIYFLTYYTFYSLLIQVILPL